MVEIPSRKKLETKPDLQNRPSQAAILASYFTSQFAVSNREQSSPPETRSAFIFEKIM